MKSRHIVPERLRKQGVTYDADSDEYITKSGYRVPREEFDLKPSANSREIIESTLNPSNIKEKISFWIDQDLLDCIKKEANKIAHKKYTHLINEVLRQYFFNEKNEKSQLTLEIFRQEMLDLKTKIFSGNDFIEKITEKAEHQRGLNTGGLMATKRKAKSSRKKAVKSI